MHYSLSLVELHKDNLHIDDSINVYTDASYSKELGGSVIGYKIDDQAIHTEFISDIKNTQAELLAIKKCISLTTKYRIGCIIRIHTDCQKALQETYPPNVVMIKMSGHMKRADMDEDQKIFSMVDRLTRKTLRSLLKDKRAKAD